MIVLVHMESFVNISRNEVLCHLNISNASFFKLVILSLTIDC